MSTKTDMLNGSLADKILLYALPVAATGMLQQLFNAADIAVVGRFGGTEAMAAVGSNGPIINLVINFFIGVALGTNVTIAHAIGSGHREQIQKAVHTSVIFALLAGLVIAVAGEGASSWILTITGVPEDVLPLSLLYLRIYLAGMPIIFLYNFEAAIFRARGDTGTPLKALLFSGALNVLMNLFFVIVLGMSVAGVALATVLSNAVSAAILWVQLLRTEGDSRLEPQKLKVDTDILVRIIRIGLPAGIQSAMFCVANIILQSGINSLGSIVMAANAAAYNIDVLTYYVLTGFSQACTTFVGQNHGGCKPDRCRKTLGITILLGYCSIIILCTVIYLNGPFLLRLFNNDPRVIELGMLRFAYIFAGYVCTVVQEMGSAYLRGFGLSAFPAAISVLGICGFRIIWINTVFRALPTYNSIMLVYPVSLGITAILVAVCVLIVRPSRRIQTEE